MCLSYNFVNVYMIAYRIQANGKMRVCGDAGLQFRVRRVRDKVRVSIRDRVGVRVSDGVRVSIFYFLSH